MKTAQMIAAGLIGVALLSGSARAQSGSEVTNPMIKDYCLNSASLFKSTVLEDLVAADRAQFEGFLKQFSEQDLSDFMQWYKSKRQKRGLETNLSGNLETQKTLVSTKPDGWRAKLDEAIVAESKIRESIATVTAEIESKSKISSLVGNALALKPQGKSIRSAYVVVLEQTRATKVGNVINYESVAGIRLQLSLSAVIPTSSSSRNGIRYVALTFEPASPGRYRIEVATSSDRDGEMSPLSESAAQTFAPAFCAPYGNAVLPENFDFLARS